MNIGWNTLMVAIYVAATVAFSLTAVLAIRRERAVDIVGAVTLGVITATGGGTVRDLVLGVPVFWSTDLKYVWVATGTSIVALFLRRRFAESHVYSLLLYLDGFGAAMFAIQAAAKTWDLGFALPVGPVIMGVITAIGGGLIRDVLSGRPTLLLRREIYATPVVLGCIAFVLVLQYLPDYRLLGGLACIFATFALRAAAIHFNLSMPAFSRIE